MKRTGNKAASLAEGVTLSGAQTNHDDAMYSYGLRAGLCADDILEKSAFADAEGAKTQPRSISQAKGQNDESVPFPCLSRPLFEKRCTFGGAALFSVV